MSDGNEPLREAFVSGAHWACGAPTGADIRGEAHRRFPAPPDALVGDALAAAREIVESCIASPGDGTPTRPLLPCEIAAVTGLIALARAEGAAEVERLKKEIAELRAWKDEAESRGVDECDVR